MPATVQAVIMGRMSTQPGNKAGCPMGPMEDGGGRRRWSRQGVGWGRGGGRRWECRVVSAEIADWKDRRVKVTYLQRKNVRR